MGMIDEATSSSSSFSARAMDLETTLKQTLENFKELRISIEQMESKLQSCEMELSKQHEKCKSQMCVSSETYKKTIESKDNIIQLAVSTVIKINETKNLNLTTQLLRILCGEVHHEILTSPKETNNNKENISNDISTTPNKKLLQLEKVSNSPMKKWNIRSPTKELNLSEIPTNDESISEIEGTPGRTSPIIHPKKLKSNSSISTSGSSTEAKDKKKCPTEWITPEAKQIKLSQPSPNRVRKTTSSGRLRQSRISYNKLKTCNVVDLTCSPDTSEGTAGSQDGNKVNHNPHIQLLIKKESSDNDDTILPSPTSGPANVSSRPVFKDSQKSSRKLSLVKKMDEADEINSPILQVVQRKTNNTTPENDVAIDPLEESINILKPNRFPKTPNKLLIKSEKSPAKFKSPRKENPPIIFKIKLEKPMIVKTEPTPMEQDVTHCEEASMSLLQHVNQLDQVHTSPTKRPLCENMNLINVSNEQAQDSMSVLPQDPANDNVTECKRSKTPEKVEPIYKEPTVRKKAEKLALPGWLCEECVNFFKDLYGNDPAKIAIIVARCSKHRGRNNPVRPKTPDGFWYPRWDVPEDTEEFNRRNNAD